ncbi:hypothetical protein WA158_004138 [Blastocystis sp. Blastoise]
MDVIIKEGFLCTKEDWTNDMIKKWYSIQITDHQPVLYEYNIKRDSSNEECRIVKSIYLSGSIIYEYDEKQKGNEPIDHYGFQLYTPLQSYVFYVEDSMLCKDWIDAIDDCVNKYSYSQNPQNGTEIFKIKVIGATNELLRVIAGLLKDYTGIISASIIDDKNYIETICGKDLCAGELLAYIEDLGHNAYFL